ncbi:IniB N-terminal domain-containing protein [Amycolatopsis magusensis]|uniref:IniB N-terminal domain-containing protein n=1 Tax=Amycolatopsis magusensis TaxID=882444 RepID=UPI0024A821F3|nr:IniB N-terminal domain-containing protein [Amycolatopsis magusensis]MDI5975002.1 IniB N-terminal domain-containing protein [Amycolatopsis magusensis]
MSPSGQTLHDFVLNLLTDETARSAFGTDPAAALSGAGLQDVTAQDVQEVVPLVLDYAPGGVSVESPESGFAALPAATDVTSTDGAIEQLQALAQVAEGGGLAGLPGLDDLTRSSFAEDTPLGSVAGAHEITPEGIAATGAYAGEQLTGSIAGDAGPQGAAGSLAADSDAVDLGSAVSGSTEGAAAAADVGTEPLSAGVAGAGGLHGVDTAFAGTSPVGDFGGDLFAATDGFAGSLNIAGQQYSIDSDSLGDLGGGHLAGLGDPATVLDSTAMPRSGEEAASATSGTLAGYVSTGGEWLAGGVATGGTTLGSYLTGADAAPIDQSVADSSGTISDQIAAGSGQLAGHLESLPIDVPADLPADLPVDAPAATPGDLPTDLPADLPAELPTDLQVELPELPELPIVNPLPSGGHDGGASESPLGQLGNGHQLPDLGDITGGLLDF